MNGQDSKAEIFHVFLCHNGEDKPAVREIAQMLVKASRRGWMKMKSGLEPGGKLRSDIKRSTALVDRPASDPMRALAARQRSVPSGARMQAGVRNIARGS